MKRRTNHVIDAATLAVALGFSVLCTGVLHAEEPPPSPAPPVPADNSESAQADQPRRPHAERRGPMMGRDDRKGRDDGDDRPISREELEKRLDLLRQVNPELSQRIDEWKDRDPQRVTEMLRDHWPRLAQLMELKRTDPEMFELRLKDIQFFRQTMDLTDQYRAAMRDKDQAKADAAKAKLTDTIRQHFDLRQKMRERELAQLETKIDDLRKGIEARKKSQDNLISQRLDSLIGAKAQAEW